MAASRVADELTDLRKSFEKTLEGGSDEEERMLDILSAMMKVVGNLDLLKQTGVVQMLKGANKKVGEGKVSNKIKDLLAKWKADCSAPPTAEVKASEAPTAPATETKVEAKPAASSSSSSLGGISRSSSSGDLEFDDGGYFKSLPINRQKVFKVIAEVIDLSTQNMSIASHVAMHIEQAINKMFDATKDERNYSSKARTLSFNLKANKNLRDEVISGSMPTQLLVTLSPKELATSDVKDARAETTKEATMARRGDLYEIKRNEILEANGIDPNKGGEFVCRKCKGTKTSHYSLQTRSSDEPMTVFVCCLTCGNRWRTQ